jgi:hypothetical protein
LEAQSIGGEEIKRNPMKEGGSAPKADKIQPSVVGLYCTFFQLWVCTAPLFFLLHFFHFIFFSFFSFLSTALGMETDVAKLIF